MLATEASSPPPFSSDESRGSGSNNGGIPMCSAGFPFSSFSTCTSMQSIRLKLVPTTIEPWVTVSLPLMAESRTINVAHVISSEGSFSCVSSKPPRHKNFTGGLDILSPII
jgi:hypothetical protein